MHNNPNHACECAKNPVLLRLPATVDNFHLASLLNPLVESQQYRICLDVSCIARLGTVEFRVLSAFAELCKRHGGFLRLENASATVAALVHEFGYTDLIRAAPDDSL